MKRFMIVAVVGLVWVTKAPAITVDGTKDAEYGAAVAVQMVETGFGDFPEPGGNNGGSELNAAYAAFDGDRLYLMFTGNHEPNFNKLDVFIDSVTGGENTFSGTPDYDFDPGGGNWISGNLGTMVMDAGITVDYHLFSRWGGGGTPQGYEVDFVNRQGGGSAMVPGSSHTSDPAVGLIASGTVPAGDVGPNASGTALTQNLPFAINNNNTAGVDGCDGVTGCEAAVEADALAVTTGMEFSIALADIGNPAPGSTIRISAMITSGDHNFLSNQVLGSFTPPQHNPGGDGSNEGDGINQGGFTGTMAGMDFNNFLGTQYFSLVVPGASNGDFNGDGFVNAADYPVWRKTDGTQAGYDAWRDNFGQPVGSGTALGASGVPEPASLVLAMAGALLALGFARRK